MTDHDDDTFDGVALVQRWWRVLVASLVIGAVAGLAATFFVDPEYSTRVEVLIGPVVADADVLEGASDLARTFGEVLETRSVVAEAADRAGVSPSSVDVLAFSTRDSSTLTVEASAPSREAVVRVAAELVATLEGVVDTAGGSLNEAGTPIVDPFEDLIAAVDPGQSGSVIVVLDDGSRGVESESLDAPIGAAIGGLGLFLVVAAALLTFEQYRRAVRARQSVASVESGVATS